MQSPRRQSRPAGVNEPCPPPLPGRDTLVRCNPAHACTWQHRMVNRDASQSDHAYSNTFMRPTTSYCEIRCCARQELMHLSASRAFAGEGQEQGGSPAGRRPGPYQRSSFCVLIVSDSPCSNCFFSCLFVFLFFFLCFFNLFLFSCL